MSFWKRKKKQNEVTAREIYRNIFKRARPSILDILCGRASPALEAKLDLFKVLYMPKELTSSKLPSFYNEVCQQIDEFYEEGKRPCAVILGMQQRTDLQMHENDLLFRVHRSPIALDTPIYLYGLLVQSDPAFDKVLVIE